jgi:hypothetical protein
VRFVFCMVCSICNSGKSLFRELIFGSSSSGSTIMIFFWHARSLMRICSKCNCYNSGEQIDGIVIIALTILPRFLMLVKLFQRKNLSSQFAKLHINRVIIMNSEQNHGFNQVNRNHSLADRLAIKSVGFYFNPIVQGIKYI